LNSPFWQSSSLKPRKNEKDRKMSSIKSVPVILLLCVVIVGGCTSIPTATEAAPTQFKTPETQIVAETESAEEENMPSHPYVILAPDDSGDFGPRTPGTKTAGWQEALDYCVSHHMDLYVKGGYGGQNAIFHIQDTIHFPPAQDFRVDGGIYVINWTGPGNKDLMVIDSCMNCELHFGILVYGGMGAAMRIKPEGPVPIDGFPVVVETEIHSQGMADPHPFTPGERMGGTGLVFDGTKAPIVHSTFLFFGVLNFQTVIETKGAFANNQFDVLHLHTNAHNSTLLKLGEGSVANSLRMAIGVDQGASGVTGIVLAGQNNTLEVMPRPSNEPFPKGRILIFDVRAEGNQVNFVAQEPSIVLEGITDLSLNPTNQISWAGEPAPIYTVEAKDGSFTYTQRFYPAAVRVLGGSLTSLELVRDSTSVDYSTAPNPEIFMSVGDQLKIESTEAPVLQIIPIKTK
jgi:hypothetical protein